MTRARYLIARVRSEVAALVGSAITTRFDTPHSRPQRTRFQRARRRVESVVGDRKLHLGNKKGDEPKVIQERLGRRLNAAYREKRVSHDTIVQLESDQCLRSMAGDKFNHLRTSFSLLRIPGTRALHVDTVDVEAQRSNSFVRLFQHTTRGNGGMPAFEPPKFFPTGL